MAYPEAPAHVPQLSRLLETKLELPAVRPGIVERRALVSRLSASIAPLTTIVGPAGYGKTTLLAEWAARDRRPFAWVALDEQDDDAIVLLRYVATALDRIERLPASVFEALAAPGASIWARAMPRLGAALAGLSQPVVLALDDVHALSAPESRDALVELASRATRGSMLVLAGRAVPDLPRARLRLLGSIQRIGPEELRLSIGESRRLLAAAGVELSETDSADLHARTEGWAAGLYLAALSLTAGGEAQAAASFRGDDRYVVDYLRLEHLSQLPAAQARFLTRTAVLESFSGELCDAVLEDTGSAAMLEEIARSNLFLVALDRQREWFRYHHLFRDLLRAELQRTEPDAVAGLNLRAAEWHEANGRPDAAIEYATAARDTARVARLVATLALPAYRQGLARTVERWMSALDDPALLVRYPGAAAVGALLHAVSGRPADADRWLDAAKAGSLDDPIGDGGMTVHTMVATVDAALCRDGPERMLADARAALAEHDGSSLWRSTPMFGIAIALLLAGDAEAAGLQLQETVEVALRTGAKHVAIDGLAYRAFLALDRGELALAESLVEQAAAFIDGDWVGDYPFTALHFAATARVALALGDQDRARPALARAQVLRPLLTRAVPWAAVQLRLELARAHLALDDPAGARTVLAEAGEILRRRPKLGVLVAQHAALRRKVDAARPRGTGSASTLTMAELRLLPFLSTHLSFQEIGQRLFVSRNTIKTQAIAVYRKLGVSSRSEAVARAAELGLVDRAAVPAARALTRTA